MPKSYIVPRAILGFAVTVLTVFAIAACGGGQEPAATPAAPTAPATAVPATATPAAQEGTQPESPLAQPESPLSDAELPETGIGHVLKDFALITRLASEQRAGAPEAGKASVSGLLYTFSTNEVIPGTPFYLVPAIKDGDRYVPPTIYAGPKKEHGDVNGTTDGYGRFSFTDVPPGVYYLAVFAPYDWLLAFESKEATSPLQIELKEGQELDLGLLWLGWP